jgi:enamine deaminase RidA (YjgF/YER057c/UK114 family)
MRHSLHVSIDLQSIPYQARDTRRPSASAAVRVGERVVVSGTAPIWPDGAGDPDPEVQARRCLEIIFSTLADAGAGPADVVRPACRH